MSEPASDPASDLSSEPARVPNPKRVAAGRANRARAGPLTEAGRQRLREAALKNCPWEHSTGPTSPAGKRRAAANGKARQRGPQSVRELRAELAPVRALLAHMVALRRAVEGAGKIQGGRSAPSR